MWRGATRLPAAVLPAGRGLRLQGAVSLMAYGLAAAGIAAYALALRHTFIDDAYIQFLYAETLVKHGTWGMIAGHAANTATSPLHVLLLAAASLLPGSTQLEAAILVAIELVAGCIILGALSRARFHSAYPGLLAAVALLVNPLVLSSFGLEGPAYVALFAGSLWALSEKRWPVLGLSLGLLVLTRPDGLVLAAIVLISVSGGWRWRGVVAGMMAVPLLAWTVYAWWAIGSIVPESALIKTSQDWGGNWTFATGLELYRRHYPIEVVASFALLPFALYALVRMRDRVFVTIPAVYALVHFVAYSLMAVPPYHWYYLHLVLATTLAGGAGLWQLMEQRPVWVLRGAMLVMPLASLAVIGWPLQEAPIHTNWGTPGQYEEIGGWIDANLPDDEPIMLVGEIGTLAYYSDRPLLNEFSDANWIAASARGFWQLNRAGTTSPMPCPGYVVEHVPGTSRPVLGERYGGTLVMQWTTTSRWLSESRLYLWSVDRRVMAEHYPGGCALR